MADSISRATVLLKHLTFQRFFLAPGTPLARTKDVLGVDHAELDIVAIRPLGQSPDPSCCCPVVPSQCACRSTCRVVVDRTW